MIASLIQIAYLWRHRSPSILELLKLVVEITMRMPVGHQELGWLLRTKLTLPHFSAPCSLLCFSPLFLPPSSFIHPSSCHTCFSLSSVHSVGIGHLGCSKCSSNWCWTVSPPPLPLSWGWSSPTHVLIWSWPQRESTSTDPQPSLCSEWSTVSEVTIEAK